MMTLRLRRAVTAAAIAAAAATACTNSNPSSPDSSSTTGSVTVPRPAQPPADAQVRFADQPVTLVIQNAVTTTSGTVYTFEVATDAAFATKVQTKDNVAEGTAGLTTVKLDALAGGRDYFWRARATSGGTA